MSTVGFELSGDGYDQELRIVDDRDRVLFRAGADSLVTSQHGEIEFRLNYGFRKTFFRTRVRRCGESAVLIPVYPAIDPAGLSFTSVVRWELVEGLWGTLGYDPEELRDVPSPTPEEWGW